MLADSKGHNAKWYVRYLESLLLWPIKLRLVLYKTNVVLNWPMGISTLIPIRQTRVARSYLKWV